MVRACEVQNRVAQEHQQLLVLAAELAAQGLVARLDDRALAHPLPELRLRRPELLAVAADHERRLLALLPLLFRRPQSLPSSPERPADTRRPAHHEARSCRALTGSRRGNVAPY